MAETHLFQEEETGVGAGVESVGGHWTAGVNIELVDKGADLVRGLVHVDARGEGVLNRQDCRITND